jgi:hypothetical protein
MGLPFGNFERWRIGIFCDAKCLDASLLMPGRRRNLLLAVSIVFV